MKYGKLMKRAGAAAFVLTVISSCIVGGTLAKYTTTVAGTGSAIVAKWAPTFKGGSNGSFNDTVEVNLTDTTLNAKVTDGKVAPGTSGSFDVQVSRGATDVEFTYSITMSNMKNRPANLKFYSDQNFNNELTETDGEYKLFANETMSLTGDESKTKTVYWQWPYAVDGETDAAAESRDAADSEAGNKATVSNADKMTFDIHCTATQVKPN